LALEDGQERLDTTNPPVIPELDERLLNAPRYRFMARKPLWSSPSRQWQVASVGRWKEHTREQLLYLAGDYPIHLWLQEALADERLYVDAWIGGQWIRASWWMVDAEYLAALASPTSEGLNASRLAAAMRSRWRNAEPRRPGQGEAAWHIVAHQGVGRPTAIEIAELAGFHIDPDNWSQQTNNGRKREKAGKPCRFC
jgi:hypothetical protein